MFNSTEYRHVEKVGVRNVRFNPKIVRERLEYTDISMMLNRYFHVTPTMTDQAIRLLGDAL